MNLTYDDPVSERIYTDFGQEEVTNIDARPNISAVCYSLLRRTSRLPVQRPSHLAAINANPHCEGRINWSNHFRVREVSWPPVTCWMGKNMEWIRVYKLVKSMSENNAYMPTKHCYVMMTSPNGNIVYVAGPLCGEFTGHRSPVNSPHKGQWHGALMNHFRVREVSWPPVTCWMGKNMEWIRVYKLVKSMSENNAFMPTKHCYVMMTSPNGNI